MNASAKWMIPLCLHIVLQMVYCISVASGAEEQSSTRTKIIHTIQTLGAGGENISDALDLLASNPQESVRRLLAQLHAIPRKTYFESTKSRESTHVISCIRALHYLTGLTFSAVSTAKLSDDETQFLDFKNEMHDDNPGHALHFFGVWMSRNADIVAPLDAQLNIINQWKQWVSQHGSTFRFRRAGKAAQFMDEWFWFG